MPVGTTISLFINSLRLARGLFRRYNMAGNSKNSWTSSIGAKGEFVRRDSVFRNFVTGEEISIIAHKNINTINTFVICIIMAFDVLLLSW